MLGLMQDFPLMVARLLSYAEKFHRDTQIVSRRLEGDIHRHIFSERNKESILAQFKDYRLPGA